MFKAPCFIRKNTPELRKELEKLGYKPLGYMDGLFIACDHISGEFETFNEDGLPNILKNPYNETPEIVDYGENEELFLAIAALRDDSDLHQWFVYKDDWYLCKYDSFSEITKEAEEGHYFGAWAYHSHKATVEELIKHFNHE
ncbi:MAG: hypothetical protein NC410_09090 [Oscillibacter sp.]|nr:hypothetical protein [Oscillibacter sp.]